VQSCKNKCTIKKKFVSLLQQPALMLCCRHIFRTNFRTNIGAYAKHWDFYNELIVLFFFQGFMTSLTLNLFGLPFLLQHENLSAFYIVQHGEVELTYHSELDSGLATWKILSHDTEWEDLNESQKYLRRKGGSYFGEQVLLGEKINSITAVAIGNVVCLMITKEKFDSVVGPFHRISQDDIHLRDRTRREHNQDINATDFSKV
jgi:CRP-like cAMP-binding protein